MRGFGPRDIVRLLVAVPILAACYWLFVDTARGGYARLLCTAAIVQAALGPADLAVKVAPRDPEAHYTRGLSLVNAGRLDDALVELREAIRIRPHYFYEWQDLGVTLDRVGDQKGGEEALREAVRLAPSFALPRWQLGNLLFSQERYEEAFEQLRLGSRTNPKLNNSLFQLAWTSSNGDSAAFLSLVRLSDQRGHFEIAHFFATHGNGSDAVLEVRKGALPISESERNILRGTVVELLKAQQFSEALDVWNFSHNLPKEAGRSEIINGYFREAIFRDDPGYGWQLSSFENMALAIDELGPSEGSRSLRVEFSGNTAISAPIVSETLLLEPRSHFVIRLKVRTDRLVSGGLPVMVASANNNGAAKVLGRSGPIGSGTTDWTPYLVDFWTEDRTPVLISLQRQQCDQSPCPIFGRLWLSEVTLSKL